MARKDPVVASRRLAFALEALSKNTLLDLVVSLAKDEVGEAATDEQLAWQIEHWLDPVSRDRKDRPVDLMSRLRYLDASDQAYRDSMGKKP